MKKMYAFLIIVAAMTTSSCKDSKKSETAETAGKPKTACDCIGKMNQVLKDINKMSVKEIATIGPDMGAYIDKKLYEGNDCKKILKESGEKYPTPESMEKDCPQVKELISLQKEFAILAGSQNSSQPEADMQNEDAGFEDENGDMEMQDMPEPEMPEDF
jgi:hypothetical protein